MPVEAIESTDDPRVAPYLGVRDPALLRERGVFLVEGREPVRVLLAQAGFRTHSLLVLDRALASLEPDLRSLPSGVPIYRVTRETMTAIAGVRFHQGCVAVGERITAPAAADLLQAAPPRGRVIVLESVTDPDNVGSAFRSALAFGIDAVLLGPGCASPLYRKAVRTSMGATLRIPFAEVGDWPGPRAALRGAGFALLGLTPDRSATALTDPDLAARAQRRLALVAGTEGDGLSPQARESVDQLVRIAMVPGVDSLNVATALAIAMHHFAV